MSQTTSKPRVQNLQVSAARMRWPHNRLAVGQKELAESALRQIWRSRGERLYHSVKGGWQQDKLRRLLRPRRKAL